MRLSSPIGRIVILIALLLPLSSVMAHESPVDHVGRELKLWWAGGRLHVAYRLILAERAALLQLRAIDTNHDGKISDEERAAFFNAFAKELAGEFHVTIDGKKLPLHPDGDARLDPELGQSFTFVADEVPLPAGKHTGELLDFYSRAYPGPYRMLSTPSAAAGAIDVSDATSVDPKEGHPGMVIVRFEVTVSGK